ncbi:MAG: DUF1800 domain-containing protein [Armatimonadetes bacterium]|nr:DUF1800 domain-containing protein [Armatimonadota bacterium]
MISEKLEVTLEEQKVGSSSTSRRGFLLGAASLGMGAMAGLAQAQRVVGPPTGRNSGAGGPGGSAYGQVGRVAGGNNGFVYNGNYEEPSRWSSDLSRLVRRISYGMRPSEATAIEALGFSGYLNQQLNPAAIDDSVCETGVTTNFPNYNNAVAPAFKNSAAGVAMIDDWERVVTYRAIYSKKQLQQRMFEFWSDHFNIDRWKVDLAMTTGYYRDTIYPNSMGKFKDILMAVSKTGAMMVYLDNTLSTANKLNVNFAREIMELYSIGVDAGYTEADIYEVARIFTGWGFNWTAGQGNSGHFVYYPAWHDPGNKTVMGVTFSSNGMAEGEAFVNWLANHPSTQEFVGRKLCKFFLGTAPSSALMSQIKSAWVSSDGDIKEILKVILTQANLTAAPAKFKRPFHYGVSTMRHLEIANANIVALWHYCINRCGDTLYYWPQPDGYPDTAEYWSQGMVHRVDFGLKFGNMFINGLHYDLTATFGASPSLTSVVDDLNNRLFYGEMSTSDKLWIRRHLRGKLLNEANLKSAVALAVAGPGFQWY